VGEYSSLAAFFPDERHISYYDRTNRRLKYARWTGSGWDIQFVDDEPDVGRYTSLVVNATGPHIAYQGNWKLKYACWTGSDWDIQTVDNGLAMGQFPSLALDSAGNPHISYHDGLNRRIKYARWTGTGWSMQIVGGAWYLYPWTSLDLDSVGNTHICYYYPGLTGGELRYARWNGSEWLFQTVDAGIAPGAASLFVAGGDRKPRIAYHDGWRLKYARSTGGGWLVQTVDDGNVGEYASLVVDTPGDPHISYFDRANGDLKYAHGMDVPPTLAEQLGGVAFAVAVQGRYGYVGVGARLIVLDVSDPTNPTLVGKTEPMRGIIKGVAVRGNYAYITANILDVQIVDVSDPRNPFAVGSLGGMGEDVAVAEDGALVYVASTFSGLSIVNVTDPGSPTRVGSYDGTMGLDVAVVGNHAFLGAGGDGLRIISVADPADPVEVGFLDGLGYAKRVAVCGDYAYVAGGDLHIVDVSDLSHPVEVGVFEQPPGRGSAGDVAVEGDHAYLVDGLGLRVLDVSDPADPVQIGFYDTPGASWDVVVAGNNAYVAAGTGGLRIIQFRRGQDPVLVGCYDTPGVARGVAADDDVVYIADGDRGLRVWDVSNPVAPAEVGAFEPIDGGEAWRVVIASAGGRDYAYVVGVVGDEGLRIVDVTDRSQPVEVGFCELGYRNVDVVVVGDYAYVGGSGLHIVDISDRANPRPVGSLESQYPTLGLAVAGDYAYMLEFFFFGRRTLVVVDISDPAAPYEIRRVERDDCDSTQSFGSDVALAGNYLYLAFWADEVRCTACSGVFSNCCPDRPTVITMDISNPTDPRWVADFFSSKICRSSQAIAVAGTRAYLVMAPRYEEWQGGVQVLDASDPAHLSGIGFSEIPSDEAVWGERHPLWDIAVAGDHAYIAAADAGLCIVDVSGQLLTPTEVGFYETLGLASDVAVGQSYTSAAGGESTATVGPFLYAVDGKSLRILDVAEETNPIAVGSYTVPGGQAIGVAVGDAGYAYVAAGGSGLFVVDVSDPANPAGVGNYDTAGHAEDVAVAGSYAFIADGGEGLQIVDVSYAPFPAWAGGYDTPGYASGVAISGSHAYIADGSSGLRIVDISHPGHPDEIGFYDTPGDARDVAVAGDAWASSGQAYAYVADMGSGLRVVDVSDPEHPAEVGFYVTPGLAYGVVVEDGWAYVAAGEKGLILLDVFDPENPMEVTSYDTLGTAVGVAAFGVNAAVADEAGGVAILRVLGDPLPTPTPTQTPTVTPTPTATPAPGVIYVPRADRPPIMDGYVGDWHGVGATHLTKNNAGHIEMEVPAYEDLSSGLWVAWSPDGLYFAARIADDVLIGNDSANLGDDDTLELGIHVDAAGRSHQFSLCVDGRQADQGLPISALTVVTQTIPDGWSLEAMVPISALGSGTLAAGQQYPFTFALWDDDLGGDGGQTHMLWRGTSSYAYQPEWGALWLHDREHDFPTPPTVTPTPTATPTSAPTPCLRYLPLMVR
jgi:hypothetical protein